MSIRYRKRFRASSARFDTFLPLDLRHRRIFPRIFRVPRSLKSIPSSCSSFFYRSFYILIGVFLFAARLDRRQLKRSYRPLQRKAALYSRFSVKGSISRLFRNKSRANREIHRGANIKQYYLANVPSARTFLKSITWNFYRRFSMDHGSIIFFLIFSLSWIHSKYFLFNIFLF